MLREQANRGERVTFAPLRRAPVYYDLGELGEVNWPVMPLQYWSEPDVKEQRQAEFLVHDWFPWSAVELIAVYDDHAAARVRALLGTAAHKPAVRVCRSWYS
jgi:hypothetical protein